MMADLIRMSMFCDMDGELYTSHATPRSSGKPINNSGDINFESSSKENECFPKFATSLQHITDRLSDRNEQYSLQHHSFTSTVSGPQQYGGADTVSISQYNGCTETLSDDKQYNCKDTDSSSQHLNFTDTMSSIRLQSSTNTESRVQLSSCLHAKTSVQPPRCIDTVSNCSDTAVPSVKLPSCTGTVPSIQTCMEFWTRIVLASKVDISTFKNVSPCAVFGNDYLHSIVAETAKQKLDNCFKNTISPDKNEMRAEDKTKGERAPNCSYPYKYTAIAIAAVYTSGEKFLTPSSIVNRMSILFPEHTKIPQAARRAMYKNIKRNKYLERHKDGTYSIVPGKVYLSTFCRKPNSSEDSQQCKSQKYATLIHDHLGFPNMLTDLGFQVVTTKQTKVQIIDDMSHKKPGDHVGINNKTDKLCGRSQSVKRKYDVDFESNKRQCLELPVRPCFHDDSSDNEDDELLKLNALSSNDVCKSYLQEKSSFAQQPVQDMTSYIIQSQQQSTMTTPIQNYYLRFVDPVQYSA